MNVDAKCPEITRMSHFIFCSHARFNQKESRGTKREFVIKSLGKSSTKLYSPGFKLLRKTSRSSVEFTVTVHTVLRPSFCGAGSKVPRYNCELLIGGTLLA